MVTVKMHLLVLYLVINISEQPPSLKLYSEDIGSTFFRNIGACLMYCIPEDCDLVPVMFVYTVLMHENYM